MRLPLVLGAVCLVLVSAGPALGGECTAPPDGDRPLRRITTPLGSIRVRLFDQPGEAPISVANFLAYADAGDYDFSFFHRLIPNLVLQGGGFTFDGVSDYEEMTLRPPIQLEAGICNAAGTLAMARPGGSNVNTATSQFFINLGDNSVAFGGAAGYAVFGQVHAHDMDIVNALGLLHREFGTLLIDDEIAIRELADETFANVPVIEVAERPDEGWGCIGGIEPDPILITIPPIPFPIWLPGIEDNCAGDPEDEQAARVLMRTDMGPKINELLITMSVPEAGWSAQAGAAFAALALARARRRGRASGAA